MSNSFLDVGIGRVGNLFRRVCTHSDWINEVGPVSLIPLEFDDRAEVQWYVANIGNEDGLSFIAAGD